VTCYPFEITIPDDTARRMTRADYYASRRYLRLVRRMVNGEMQRHGEVLLQAYKQVVFHGRAEIECTRYTDGSEKAIGVVLLPHR
jgi:hypothetical protein